MKNQKSLYCRAFGFLQKASTLVPVTKKTGRQYTSELSGNKSQNVLANHDGAKWKGYSIYILNLNM